MLDDLPIGLPPARIVLTILDGFLGLSAVLGGLALALGWLGIPAKLLDGSPFGSYTIPALFLIVLVGGGGALATVLLLLHSAWGLAASGIAGLIILIFEAVELVVIGFSWLLAAYIALGLTILSLAARLWLAERDAPADTISEATAGGIA